jgi:hypothetical protein
MNLLFQLLALASGVAAAASTPPDVLRLADGELAGKFSGISAEGILRWTRDDSPSPLEFNISKARHIALRGGIPARAEARTSHIELIDGDRVVGTITGLLNGEVSLDSPHTGPIVVSQNHIRRLSPNPFGGNLIYAGPFTADGWEVVDSTPPDRLEDQTEEDNKPSWQHSAGHWYYTGGRDALRYPVEMPDRALFRFHMDWRSRPSISIAIHADFAAPPPPAEKVDDEEIRQPDLPVRMFGNALIISIRSNYATLQHSGYTLEGQPFTRHLRSSTSGLRIDESGDADFEIRSNLDEGIVSLFVDGSFWLQWNLESADDARPLGSGIGYLINEEAEHYRLTDILVAEWNGMPDAARSFESPDHDIILMTNGTDRFSGKVTAITGGMVKLDGPYADLEIPLPEVASIHFANSGKKDEEEVTEDGSAVRVHFLPVGRLHGTLIEADSTHIILHSPALGRIKARLESASLLEFSRQGMFLQEWDEDL